VWLVGCQETFHHAFAAAAAQTTDLALGGAFRSPAEAVAKFARLTGSQMVLINAQHARIRSVEGLTAFKSAFPTVPLFLMLDHLYEEALSDLIEAGVRGCLLNSAPITRVIESVREIRNGGVPLAPEVAGLLLDRIRHLIRIGRDYKLTARELGILKLMVRGFLTKQIAQELHLSYHTVDTHLRNIYAKLGVHSRASAVAKALGEQLV
jgi:DNA-binding NarL/FixJ family response regulator